ncbi:Cysteine--tRNA ligase [Buchnera aphidicola (Tetraneura ulmi)]|uniref:cysteine--tRNA ligase n=1 Tax=Buchnera aphidicola TaxID=9 RepID=UPI0034642E29
MLKIFNTLTRKKEIFKSIVKNKIGIYVCGVTVYDLCHLGHARTFLIFDMIIRYLKNCNYKVNYIRNITDIDDKIILKSIQKKESFVNFSNRMILEMNNDFSKINLLKPNFEPKVSNCINNIIKIISNLIKKKYAYIGKNGDVFFSIKKYSNYGKISNRKINNFKKKNIFHNSLSIKKDFEDFVLWKLSKKDNEPHWSSPWGEGRPGWHIECSAITEKYLGCEFDIHGGGIDLLFPHHENEIAQSSCFNDSFSVSYWIHTGLLVINNLKMSKSLNNSLILKDVLKKFDGDVIRFFFLSTHYRSPLEYFEEKIKKSKKSFEKIRKAVLFLNSGFFSSFNNFCNSSIIEEDNFHSAMKNDFNTPKAISVLFSIVKKINFFKKNKNLKNVFLYSFKLKELVKILGFFTDQNVFLKDKDINEETLKKRNKKKSIALFIKLRNKARKQKKWDLADSFKEKLLEFGVVIEDKSYKDLK